MNLRYLPLRKNGGPIVKIPSIFHPRHFFYSLEDMFIRDFVIHRRSDFKIPFQVNWEKDGAFIMSLSRADPFMLEAPKWQHKPL